MIIALDCGTDLQLVKTAQGWQLFEVGKWDCQEVKAIGRVHQGFDGLVEEILHCALSEYEMLSLQEMRDVVASTLGRIEDYFKAHDAYLASL